MAIYSCNERRKIEVFEDLKFLKAMLERYKGKKMPVEIAMVCYSIQLKYRAKFSSDSSEEYHRWEPGVFKDEKKGGD